ncbi:MAG: hypothetical protein P8Y94_13860 [Acidobacteriota bacterium]
MVTQRLSTLSLGEPFTVIPEHPIRRDHLTTPQDTQKAGANLVLMGSLATRNGNVDLAFKLVSTKNAREFRHAEVQSPLSQPADLEYQTLEKTLSFLKIGRDPPNRKIIKSYPGSQATYDYFLRGLGHYLSGEITASTENLQKALQMEPHFELAMAYLGLALLKGGDSGQQGSVQNAEQLCRRARDLDHQLQVADFCLGEVASAKGDSDEALGHYEAAIQEGSLDYRSLYALWAALDHLGRLDRLVPVLKAAIEKEPGSWIGYDFLACAYYGLSDFESAVVQEKKAVELAPKRATGYRNLAVFYDRLGCPEQRAESYAAALELERDWTTYSNLATTQYYAGHYAEALEAAQAAKVYMDRKEEPDYVVAGNLADIFFWAPGGNRETADEFYREALEVVGRHLEEEPDDQEAIQSRCRYLAMLGKTDAARGCLASALAIPPVSGDACYRVALVYQKLGQDDEALEYLKRSLKAGRPVGPIRNEPIFRENRRVQDLLSSYPEEQRHCP